MGNWSQEQCPPAIVDVSEGYTAEEIQEARDRVRRLPTDGEAIQLEEWALRRLPTDRKAIQARWGTIDPALATYLDENMPGWRDL